MFLLMDQMEDGLKTKQTKNKKKNQKACAQEMK